MRTNKLNDLDRFGKDGESSPNRPDRLSRTKTDTIVFRNPNIVRRKDGEADLDSEGWSTVKPRKSFGHEGAERFQGSRMGGAASAGGGLERLTSRDNGKRDRVDDRDNGDRRNRVFDQQPRDKDGEDPAEGSSRWNGLNNRTKTEREPRANREINSEGAPLTQRERIDRTKSWRDRASEDRPTERNNDRQTDRGYERRQHDNDHRRSEREPEWDDPHVESKPGGRTLEDFQKFLELQRARENPVSADKPAPAPETVAEAQPKKYITLSSLESGPDKFFAAYGGGPTLEVGSPSVNDSAPKPKAAAKSRFTSFFAQETDTSAKTEIPTMPTAPPAMEPREPTEADRRALESEAFKMNILQKLQLQVASPGPEPQRSNPPTSRATPSFSEHSSGLGSGSLAGLFPSMMTGSQPSGSAVSSPGPFQQYGGGADRDRRDDPRTRGPAQHQKQQPNMGQDIGHELTSPRPAGPPSYPPAPRQDSSNLQDLFTQQQRHPAYGGMPTGRMDQSPGPGPLMNKDNDFLLQLMKSHMKAPEPHRTEQHMGGGMPQPMHNQQRMNNQHPSMSQGRPLGNLPGNELDMQQRERERALSQRQNQGQMRPNGPPSFFDQFHPSENDNRAPGQQQQHQQPQHPTQILQRPPPPGLDHHFAQLGLGGPGPMPAQRGPMVPPPPGLMNRDPRGHNAGPGGPGPVPGMFPPNFDPRAFPPGPNGLPEGLLGPGGPGGPAPGRGPPPGFFGGGPPAPPGFMGGMPGLPPPNMGGFPPQGGPGPDFGMPGMPPFDGRNMPPPPGAQVGFRRP